MLLENIMINNKDRGIKITKYEIDKMVRTSETCMAEQKRKWPGKKMEKSSDKNNYICVS